MYFDKGKDIAGLNSRHNIQESFKKFFEKIPSFLLLIASAIAAIIYREKIIKLIKNIINLIGEEINVFRLMNAKLDENILKDNIANSRKKLISLRGNFRRLISSLPSSTEELKLALATIEGLKSQREYKYRDILEEMNSIDSHKENLSAEEIKSANNENILGEDFNEEINEYLSKVNLTDDIKEQLDVYRDFIDRENRYLESFKKNLERLQKKIKDLGDK